MFWRIQGLGSWQDETGLPFSTDRMLSEIRHPPKLIAVSFKNGTEASMQGPLRIQRSAEKHAP